MAVLVNYYWEKSNNQTMVLIDKCLYGFSNRHRLSSDIIDSDHYGDIDRLLVRLFNDCPLSINDIAVLIRSIINYCLCGSYCHH